MDLILWRHADAGGPTHGGDLPRPLSPKGLKEAKKMAVWLDERLPDRVKMYVSPAVRTQETAKALTTEFKTCPELLPNATSKAVLELIGWPKGDHTALVVGHQPWIGKLIALLVAKVHMEWHFRKGSIYWLTSHRKVEGDVMIRAVIGPKDI